MNYPGKARITKHSLLEESKEKKKQHENMPISICPPYTPFLYSETEI